MRKSNRFAALLLVFLFSFGTSAAVLAQTGLPGPRIPPRADASSATASNPMLPLPAVAGVAAGAGATDDPSYRLGTGDKIKFTVYGEDDLTAEAFVDGSGQVQLPLLGTVKAQGLSLHEFVVELTAKLSDGFLKDPQVNVQVENYRPFYIIGEVNKPGEYPYESGLTILGAVALAGGYTYRAQDRRVYIRRGGGDKEETLPADNSTKISPGDIVRIDERIF